MKLIMALIVIVTLFSCQIEDAVDGTEDDQNENTSGNINEDSSDWERAWGGGYGYPRLSVSSNRIYNTGSWSNSSNLVVFTTDGEQLISKTWINEEMTTGFRSILTDSDDNIYLTGYGDTEERSLLIKFDKDIKELWRVALPEEHYATNAALFDNDGNILLGTTDGGIYKYSPEGKELWSHNISEEEDRGTINAIVIDPEGNIYAGGYAWRDLFEEVDGEGDAFLVKISSDGTHVWERQWSGENQNHVRALVYDEAENVLYAGGGGNFILKKISAKGDELWSVDGPGILALTMDNEGNIYAGSGDSVGFILKFNADGELIWQSEVVEDTVTHDIECDSSGNIYAAGKLENHKNFLIKIPVSEMQ